MRFTPTRAAVALALVSSTLIAAPLVSHAQEAVEQVSASEGVTSRWFVELNSLPTAEGGSLATVQGEKAAFRRNAARAGLSYREVRAFDVLWNGLSVEISPSQLSKLARIEGVKRVYPVETYRIPETMGGAENPDLATALAQSGAHVAQNELGLSGQGVRVAIMDTGVDYHHPDLGGCFGPGCRVFTGHDFVGDKFNADSTSPSYNPVAVPDLDPDDCHGHGTHVAGIVGASGTVKGVAPGVTFGAYRVFGCDGSTTADIMIAAMERALADGMHILNMSIGSSFQWPQYPTAQASDRLVNKGMSVVASIGNSGANGLYSTGAPGVAKKVIGVASFDNTHVDLATFTITPDNMAIGHQGATASPAAPTSGSLPMARTATTINPTPPQALPTNDGCNPLPAGSMAGKAVLIRRGTCTFHVKSLNAQNAGAAAVVLYNNVAGRFAATVAGSPAITIPVVSISDAEGVLINNRLVSGAVTMTWTAQAGSFVNATGNRISSFSSFGLSPDLELKPDIGAPGGLIRSTWPLEKGGYATISGTSMSSPHTAGAVALLLEAKPNTPSNAVRAILQNSADPKPFSTTPFLDNAHRQGAGMVDIPQSVLATTRIEPSKLGVGESEAGPATRTLTISNNGSAEATYTLSHAPALATGANTFAPSLFIAPASVAFSVAGVPVSSVTVPAGASATVDVTITAPAGLQNKGMYGGYVVLTANDGVVSRVPFAGFKGDYQSIQVLAPTAAGFPWLAQIVGPNFVKRTTPAATFTMVGNDIPHVLLHLAHQSRRIRIEVIDAASGKSWHRALDLEYVGRNPVNAGVGFFFSLPWDGETIAGTKTYTVPNGTYILRLSVQKALGDDANSAHFEVWDSPTFIIARP